MATAAQAYEAMIASPSQPDADKPTNLHNAVLLTFQAKDYAKTVQYAQQLQQMQALDQKTSTILISPDKLRELAERIAKADAAQKKSGRSRKNASAGED